MSGAGDLFLQQFIDHPERLPEAPEHHTPEMSRDRIQTGVWCIMCGETADYAYIAQTCLEDQDTGEQTTLDTRWLDLCATCSTWVVDGNTVEGYQDEE